MTTAQEHADDKAGKAVLDALRAENTKLHSWLTEAEQYRGHLSRVRLEAAALRAENERLRAQLAEAQAAQTSNQYPPITTEIIYQHVQANQARHFLRVSWKDGIDIEEPTHGVEYLLHAYADAAREGWASPEEVRTLRAAIDAARGESNAA